MATLNISETAENERTSLFTHSWDAKEEKDFLHSFFFF